MSLYIQRQLCHAFQRSIAFHIPFPTILQYRLWAPVFPRNLFLPSSTSTICDEKSEFHFIEFIWEPFDPVLQNVLNKIV